MSVSIVIPAYQEAHRLPRTLERIVAWRKKWDFEVEVIIVVEPGTDTTREIASAVAARERNFRMLTYPERRGKGHAVRTGMREAKGEFIFYMDADLSVPISEVDGFLTFFCEHLEIDVLFGNRQHAKSRISRRQSWLRDHLGQTFNIILHALGATQVRDTQCGFKAFRREAARAIFARQQLDGFAFDVEVLLLAEHLGYRVADLPVEWINSPESKVSLFRDSARMLWDALRVRRLVAENLNDG